MKLVLFDIDGTLVKNNRGLLSESGLLIKKHFGIDIDPAAINGSGMTDRGILSTRLKHFGVKKPEKDSRFENALNDWHNITNENIEKYGVEVISNAKELLDEFSKEEVVLGVLTGNTPKRAELKLAKAGLWNYFTVGAFGHAHIKRSKLVGVAIKDALEKTGIVFKKKDIVIIGDTVRDIECAKEAGVKVIAVATGKESIEILKNEKPDFVFVDLKDISGIIKAVFS